MVTDDCGVLADGFTADAEGDEAGEADWLRLASAELQPGKLHTLLASCGYDPAAALASATVRSAELGLTPGQARRVEAAARSDGEKLLTATRRVGAHVVTREGRLSGEYPQSLRELPSAPPILHVRGRLHPDDKFSVAVVGSRRAGSYGLAIAERFAGELCGHGLCIVSGGARGIDTRAHRGALAAGGRTVAFIGCGLDVVYPAENRALFDEIAGGGRGAVVSEYPFGAAPDPWRFPARNRLIAGLSLGTLVIESDVSSGAMITANDAANFGREVFAVPGSIESGRSSGCHRLIQEGAKLTQSTSDILQELGILQLAADLGAPQSSRPYPQRGGAAAPLLRAPSASASLPPAERQILDLLSLESCHVDFLAESCGLPAASVVAALTLLEVKNLARRVPGNAFVRVL